MNMLDGALAKSINKIKFQGGIQEEVRGLSSSGANLHRLVPARVAFNPSKSSAPSQGVLVVKRWNPPTSEKRGWLEVMRINSSQITAISKQQTQ